ncbi:glycosyltransferase [beta proteobacterium MWH-UniP1]
MKTLEILIPTHKRPHSAAEAMESALICEDVRFGIRCNSNGFEPLLERYRAFDSRLIYDSFDKNMGALANGAYLLSATNAKFCMLLSDEDRVDTKSIPELVDFLENLSADVSVISCSVFDLIQNRFYFLPHERYKNISCDINLYAALGLIPSYMSGIVFRTESLHRLNLEHFIRPAPGNAYGHLDIALKLLVNSKLRFYFPKLVLKGKEIKLGGDGYSHKSKSHATTVRNNLDLNPEVYGPYARVRQFYYQLAQLSSVKTSLEKIPYLLAISRNALDFINAVRGSANVVVLSSGAMLRTEIQRGLADSFLEEPKSRSFISRIFAFAILSSPSVFNLVVRPSAFVLRILGRLYTEVAVNRIILKNSE